MNARGGWRRPRQRIALLFLVALVSMVVLVPSGHPSSTPARSSETRPSALWDAFPLRVAPSPAVPRAGLRPPVAKRPAAAAAAVVRSKGSSRSVVLFAAGATVLALLAAMAAFLLLRGPAARWSRAMAAAASTGRASRLPTYAFASSALRAAEQSYLLVVPGRMGLRDRMVERMGIPPTVGEVIFDRELGRTGQAYVVERIGASPLPSDRRPCAILRAL